MMFKQRIKNILGEFVYFFYKQKIFKNKIKVYSIDKTIDELLNTNKSLVRFGDSDIALLRGKSEVRQQATQTLSEDLKRILRYEHDGLMVAIPDIFDGVEQYHQKGKKFWKDQLLITRKIYEKGCNLNRVYGNAFVTRCYYLYKNKENADKYFQKFRQLWEGKEIVMIEGETSHFGVGNNLFDTAKSVERIIGPSQNAYAKIKEIEKICKKYPKDRLFLVALGAAAKPLAETLFENGYRVIDVGNLDMEYEWFLAGTLEKLPISKQKVIGIEENHKAGYDEYLSQIKARVC
ncbi:MAG: DUF1792 domain-containing protein [Firmicutes bacterium]|nr:DUF1792 domain-containing protein [Bacillota bacterium]